MWGLCNRTVLAVLAALTLTVPAAAQTSKLEKIKIALHWNAPIAGFVHYYAAQSLGFYKAEGLDVELVGLPGSSAVITSVSNGDTQFGQAGAETIVSAAAKRANLKAVFLVYQKNPDGVIVYKDSKIQDFGGLRGKTISMTVQGSEAKMLNVKLRQAGLNPERDLTLLNVAPGAKLTMMLTGQADATAGFLNFQLIQAQMQGKEVSFLPFSTDKEPLFGHAIVVNSVWLAGNNEPARRFVRATLKGVVWSKDNFDKAVDMIVGWDSTLKVDRDLVKRDLAVSLSDLTSGGLAKTKGLGYMDEAGWANLAAALEEKIDPATIFTNDLIPPDAPKW